jgi:hypothetical protein
MWWNWKAMKSILWKNSVKIILVKFTNTKSTWEKVTLRTVEEIVTKKKYKTIFRAYDK